MDRNSRRPPDVEEALSSMLWTPYERTPSESSSDEEDKFTNKLKKSKTAFDYDFPMNTRYVPSYRKIERYDNFNRFSYPTYYNCTIPAIIQQTAANSQHQSLHNSQQQRFRNHQLLQQHQYSQQWQQNFHQPFLSQRWHLQQQQKCITEPPSYESLYSYSAGTPAVLTGLTSRLVHSLTDNFITQEQSFNTLHSSTFSRETEAALLQVTRSENGSPANYSTLNNSGLNRNRGTSSNIDSDISLYDARANNQESPITVSSSSSESYYNFQHHPFSQKEQSTSKEKGSETRLQFQSEEDFKLPIYSSVKEVNQSSSINQHQRHASTVLCEIYSADDYKGNKDPLLGADDIDHNDHKLVSLQLQLKQQHRHQISPSSSSLSSSSSSFLLQPQAITTTMNNVVTATVTSTIVRSNYYCRAGGGSGDINLESNMLRVSKPDRDATSNSFLPVQQLSVRNKESVEPTGDTASRYFDEQEQQEKRRNNIQSEEKNFIQCNRESELQQLQQRLLSTVSTQTSLHDQFISSNLKFSSGDRNSVVRRVVEYGTKFSMVTSNELSDVENLINKCFSENKHNQIYIKSSREKESKNDTDNKENVDNNKINDNVTNNKIEKNGGDVGPVVSVSRSESFNIRNLSVDARKKSTVMRLNVPGVAASAASTILPSLEQLTTEAAIVTRTRNEQGKDTEGIINVNNNKTELISIPTTTTSIFLSPSNSSSNIVDPAVKGPSKNICNSASNSDLHELRGDSEIIVGNRFSGAIGSTTTSSTSSIFPKALSPSSGSSSSVTSILPPTVSILLQQPCSTIKINHENIVTNIGDCANSASKNIENDISSESKLEATTLIGNNINNSTASTSTSCGVVNVVNCYTNNSNNNNSNNNNNNININSGSSSSSVPNPYNFHHINSVNNNYINGNLNINDKNSNSNHSDPCEVNIIPDRITRKFVSSSKNSSLNELNRNNNNENNNNNNVNNCSKIIGSSGANSDDNTMINEGGNNNNNNETNHNNNSHSEKSQSKLFLQSSEVKNSPERTFISTESQTDDFHMDSYLISGGTTTTTTALSAFTVSPSSINYRSQQQQYPITEIQEEQNVNEMGSLNSGLIMSSSSSGQQQISNNILSQTEALINRDREQRRRERRRQNRNNRPLLHPHSIMPPPPPPVIRPMLPDILHSHFPPPYTALSLTNPPPPASSLIAPVISTVPIAATTVNDGRFTIPLPMIRRSPSERSGKGCCGQWFAGPPLRALIAVVALGGVACALGGAALGATGLAGPPTSHLTAALLMIGVGVILVTVSGAAWRMTAPGGPPCLGLGSTVDLGRCGRRPCSNRGGAPHGLLYPEFQHRPPPPSYQASMQEYRLRLLLLDRDRQSGIVRGGSPPPTYRSHSGSLVRTPMSTARRHGGNGIGGCSSAGTILANGLYTAGAVATGNGTLGSSVGAPGSEYSLPPSYYSRSDTGNVNRNAAQQAPAISSPDESIESITSNNFNTLSSVSQHQQQRNRENNDNVINDPEDSVISKQPSLSSDRINRIQSINMMKVNETTQTAPTAATGASITTAINNTTLSPEICIISNDDVSIRTKDHYTIKTKDDNIRTNNESNNVKISNVNIEDNHRAHNIYNSDTGGNAAKSHYQQKRSQEEYQNQCKNENTKSNSISDKNNSRESNSTNNSPSMKYENTKFNAKGNISRSETSSSSNTSLTLIETDSHNSNNNNNNNYNNGNNNNCNNINSSSNSISKNNSNDSRKELVTIVTISTEPSAPKSPESSKVSLLVTSTIGTSSPTSIPILHHATPGKVSSTILTSSLPPYKVSLSPKTAIQTRKSGEKQSSEMEILAHL